MNEILINALSTAMLGIFTALGMALNAWLNRRKKHQCDLAVAREKLRAISIHLGLEVKEIKSMDDVFEEIRRINTTIGISNNGNGQGHE